MARREIKPQIGEPTGSDKATNVMQKQGFRVTGRTNTQLAAPELQEVRLDAPRTSVLLERISAAR
jgi:hypothetical protein